MSHHNLMPYLEDADRPILLKNTDALTFKSITRHLALYRIKVGHQARAIGERGLLHPFIRAQPLEVRERLSSQALV